MLRIRRELKRKELFLLLQVMIRILTLYVVPISFAIILLIGLVGNTLVIFVVSNVIIIIGIEVKNQTFLLSSKP